MMHYITKSNWVLGTIILTLTTGIGWADELQQSIVLVPTLKKVSPALDALDYTKKIFKYKKQVPVSSQIQKIDNTLHRLPMLEKTAIELLQNDDNLTAGRNVLLPIWGVIYTNLPELTGKEDAIATNSPQYALALMFSKKYEEAEKTALNLVEENPENYGANVVLGLLSIQKKALFPYLKKAFQANPAKTIAILDWHVDTLEITTSKDREWDFIGAYLDLLLENRKVFAENTTFDPRVLIKILSVIRSKYYDINCKSLLQDVAKQNELQELLKFINTDLSKKIMIEKFQSALPEKSPASAQESDVKISLVPADKYETYGIMTPSGFYFTSYDLRWLTMAARTSNSTIRGMDRYDEYVKNFLGNNNFCSELPMSLSAWGGIYAGLPRVQGNSKVATDTFQYAFSLLFIREYVPSEKILLRLLEKDKENYEANVLLGMLSQRNKEYFHYLEKAFAINAEKTIYLICWQGESLEITGTEENQWDFLDAFIGLLLSNPSAVKKAELTPSMISRLRFVISSKCYDENKTVRPEFRGSAQDITSILKALNTKLSSRRQSSSSAITIQHK